MRTATTVAPARMKRRWFHRRGFRVATAVTAIALVLGTCEALGWRFLREPLSGALTRAAGVPVQLGGEFRLHLLGPARLRADSLVVGAAQEVDVDALVRAQNIALGWRWQDAWRAAHGGPVVIQHLSASQLEAHLVRLKDGRASWALGADRSASETPSPQARHMPLPRVERLHLEQGTVAVIDETTSTQMALTANSTTDGRGMAFTAKGRLRALPVDLRARVDDSFALVQGDGESSNGTVRVDGTVGRSTVHFEGRVGALQSEQRLDGALRLRGASLAAVGDIVGITLPQTPPFDLQGKLAHDGGIWRLDAQKFVVGSSALGGSFAFDSRATPPLLTGQLTGRRLLLADLGPSIGGEGGTASPAAADAGARRVLPDRKFDLPSLRAMDAELTVDIAQLDLNTPALAPLSKLQASVGLTDGILKVQELRAQAPGGTVTGSMQLDGRGSTAQWGADLTLSGIDVARWLRVGDSRAATPAANGSDVAAATSSISYLTGALAAKMKVTGAGQSTADIIGSLDGQVDALIRNGTVSHLLVEAAGLDLAQGLGILIRGDDALPMRCARFQLAARDGIATVTRGVIDNKDTTLLVTGELSLRKETLALKAVAKPKDVSLFTLRSPLHITGPWSSPSVKLESGKLAGKAVASLVLGAIAGPAALLPFIDLGSDTHTDPCTATAQR
jgi:AsmA family protein